MRELTLMQEKYFHHSIPDCKNITQIRRNGSVKPGRGHLGLAKFQRNPQFQDAFRSVPLEQEQKVTNL